jgi:hypothetical protein
MKGLLTDLLVPCAPFLTWSHRYAGEMKSEHITFLQSPPEAFMVLRRKPRLPPGSQKVLGDVLPTPPRHLNSPPATSSLPPCCSSPWHLPLLFPLWGHLSLQVTPSHCTQVILLSPPHSDPPWTPSLGWHPLQSF